MRCHMAAVGPCRSNNFTASAGSQVPIAYLALFGVDFKYTYALEMRLHEAASVDFSQRFVSTVSFESPPCYIFKSS